MGLGGVGLEWLATLHWKRRSNRRKELEPMTSLSSQKKERFFADDDKDVIGVKIYVIGANLRAD